MKKLELVNRTAKVTNLNSTTEKHGDKDVPVVDLSLRTTIVARDIARLSALAFSEAVGDRWGQMLFTKVQDLAGGRDRFLEHNISGLSFMTEVKHHNLTLNAPGKLMQFTDVKLSKFAIECDYEDHTLVLTFQARFQPSGLADELMDTQKRTVTIDISPPDEKQLELILKEARKLAQKGKAAATPERKDGDQAPTKPTKGGRAFKQAGVIDGTGKGPLQ